MDKLVQPEVLNGSVNLLKQIVVSPIGPYKSWEQQALDNVLTELDFRGDRIKELERKLNYDPQ